MERKQTHARHLQTETGTELLPDENDEWTVSRPLLKVSVRAIIRKIIKKWKLPKGCRIELQGRWVGDVWILKTK